MEKIHLAKVQLEEIDLLRNIAIITFTDTFQSDNQETNFKKYIDDKLSIDKIKKELENEKSTFYFAKVGEEIVGYLKVNIGEAQTENKNLNALEIERIYVLENFHGKRIGEVLLSKAIDDAKKHKAEYLWLGVWENNDRAIQFYKKHGFVEFDKHLFILGDEEQTDIMMKLEIE